MAERTEQPMEKDEVPNAWGILTLTIDIALYPRSVKQMQGHGKDMMALATPQIEAIIPEAVTEILNSSGFAGEWRAKCGMRLWAEPR